MDNSTLYFYDIRRPDHEGGYYTIERVSVDGRAAFGAAHSLSAAHDLLPAGVQCIERRHHHWVSVSLDEMQHGVGRGANPVVERWA